MITVAICAHNSEHRLEPTLRHIAAQTTPGEPWELLLVDSCSSDGTNILYSRLWPALSDVPFRLVRAPKPGLMIARRIAIHESQGDKIVFVDDDNWLDQTYLEVVAATFNSDPQCVATGGSASGVFEIDPPDHLVPHLYNLAIGGSEGKIDPISKRTLWLWGAGLSVRKSAIKCIFERGFTSLLQGRTGKKSLSGEDSELCCALALAGGVLKYNDVLHLKHWIPKNRLTDSYMLKTVRGHARSAVIVDQYLSRIREDQSSELMKAIEPEKSGRIKKNRKPER